MATRTTKPVNKSTFAVVFLSIAVGIGASLLWFRPSTKTTYITHDVSIPLSAAELDSMRLAIEIEVRGTIKPIILTKVDTSLARERLNEIFSLRDSLRGKAKLILAYDTDSLKPYNDTLHVSADFISDSIGVRFRPTSRILNTQITDTLLVPESSSTTYEVVKDVLLIGLGAVLRGL
jgi:hypothetical protein